MGKKIMTLALVMSFLALVALPAAVQADKHGRKMGCQRCQYKGKGHKEKGLDEKIFYKAHFLMKNQEELGLSDEQVEKIKDLKVDVKKDLIKKDAEIEILAVDIKAKLYEDKIDVKAINKLVDQKYEIKKEKAKTLVEKYAALKGMLSEEQMGKLKGLFKKCEKR